jgi:hypothetical protein
VERNQELVQVFPCLKGSPLGLPPHLGQNWEGWWLDETSASNIEKTADWVLLPGRGGETFLGYCSQESQVPSSSSSRWGPTGS